MDIQGMITDLQARRVQIDNAITVLGGLNGHGTEPQKRGLGRPRVTDVAAEQSSRKMSAATRKRMSLAMKKRWREIRKAG